MRRGFLIKKMDKEKENSKNMQEKGTENPSTNHLLPSDNSMKGNAKVSSDGSSEVNEGSDSSSSSKALVCANRNGKTPSSDKNIMCEILGRLRSKYLMRFKSVSTQWKSWVETDSYMIDLHYQFQNRRKTFLFISSPPQPVFDETKRGGTIDFTTVLPTEVQKLELDRSGFGIPKQTVAGLVCITAGGEAFLIYNPSTGERTPWIQTGKAACEVDCIAFGYSPITKEHKVLCISSKKKKGVSRGLAVYIPSMPYTFEGQFFCIKKFEKGKETKVFDHDEDAEEVGVDEEQVCEVFTVGENTWRRIDAVPPYSLASKICYVGDANTYNKECKSVYVKGKIYWRFRYTRKGEVMMVFDVRTEKFTVISIPEYVTKAPKKYPQTVELLEVDDHIAVLMSTNDCPISLWLLHQGGGNVGWSCEEIRTPCNWIGNQDFSIAVLNSTLVILKRQLSETTYVYNRVKKTYSCFTVNERHGLNHQPGELRQILTLVDSIAPVCIKRCNMF